LLLARPEYLNECTLSRFPGSDENCTAPSLFVLPRFTRNALESRIRDQMRDSEAILLVVGSRLNRLISWARGTAFLVGGAKN